MAESLLARITEGVRGLVATKKEVSIYEVLASNCQDIRVPAGELARRIQKPAAKVPLERDWPVVGRWEVRGEG